jgi:hypothetical protein
VKRASVATRECPARSSLLVRWPWVGENRAEGTAFGRGANSKGVGAQLGGGEREARFRVLNGINDEDGRDQLHTRGGFNYGLKFRVLGGGGGRWSNEEEIGVK